MTFLRLLGDSLSWNDDRMALTVFAHIATPQIRLTTDPNTVFFFLDHLHGRPPFRLQDDTTWDTNLEQGIAWGLRLFEKDRELHGPSPNGKLFIMLSDGESWSGEVARSIERAGREHVPLYVIGVGTLGGGPLPESTNADGTIEPSPGRSRLDRASLQRIAAAGGGQYFELDRDADRDIANAIIDAGRRQGVPAARTLRGGVEGVPAARTLRGGVEGVPAARTLRGGLEAPTTLEDGSVEELYWRFLVSAIGLAALAALFLRERAELWIQLTASLGTAVVVLRLIAL